MKKFNRIVDSTPALEELLASLQIEGDVEDCVSGEECGDAEAWSSTSGDGEWGLDMYSRTSCLQSLYQEVDVRDLKAGRIYKITSGPSPFSLFNICRAERTTGGLENTAVPMQRLVVPERREYGFSDEELSKYRTRRRRRTRKTCPNWDDSVEDRRNEPRMVGFRSLVSRHRE